MPPRHYTPDEFREHGHALVEWIATYLERLPDLPITPPTQPGDVRSSLPAHAPTEPEPFQALLEDLDDVVVPNLVHWQSPGWFAYFPANHSPVSVLAEFATAALGNQGMLWSTGPAATEIEAHVLDWLAELLDVPRSWRNDTGPGGGVIQMSASDSTHLVHVVARERAVADGAATDDLVAYASTQAHSSVEKGARVAGFRHVRLVEVDDVQALRPQALAAAIAEDVDRGLTPAIVTSAVGTTGTTAVDPVRIVGELAREHGLWHHVDAAYAGSAMICPEFREHHDGLDLVDSYSWNPHKWLLTNFDCSVLWVADRQPLVDTMSIAPPYLRNAASDAGAVIDYRDWHVPLGRRFRALKLWWVLRAYGADGLRAMIREHVDLAHWLAQQVQAHDRLELVAPVPFALVCLAHRDGNDATDALATAINATGHSHVTPSEIDGRRFIRVSIGQAYTDRGHVARLWHVITEHA